MNKLCQEYLSRAIIQAAIYAETHELKEKTQRKNPKLVGKSMKDYPVEYQQCYQKLVDYVNDTFALHEQIQELLPDEHCFILSDDRVFARNGDEFLVFTMVMP